MVSSTEMLTCNSKGLAKFSAARRESFSATTFLMLLVEKLFLDLKDNQNQMEENNK